MKKIKKLLIVLMCVSCISTPVNAQAITKSQTTTNVKTTAKPSGLAVNKARNGITNWKKPPKKGWYTLKNGKKRYYRKSKYIKGLKKLGSYRYFFSMKNGVMATSDVTYKGCTYFVGNKGHITAWRKGDAYYNPNGSRMNNDEIEVFRAENNARKVIRRVTNDKMTIEEKKQSCFRWVMNNKKYANIRQFKNGSEAWFAINANDYFERGIGNCWGSASSFAYLAKVLGYNNVYICSDGTKTEHTWAEIEGLVYDPLYAKSRGVDLFYGVSYEKYSYEKQYYTPYFRVKLS